MEETLKRVDLMQYFVKTISSSSKLEAVIDLMDEYQIFSSQGVLFLDHDETNINQVKDHIPITYHIPKVWCNLRGPTFEDFELIESIIGTQTADCASKPQLAEEESKESLSEMESDLYEDIKKKIMAAPHQSINDMDCVQWIYSNWGMYPSRRDLFIYFAETFQQIIVSTSNPKHGAWWSACLLLQKLLKYESKDCELYGWLANGLSHLNHVDSADLYYKLAFEHGGDAVDTIVKDYAFSLLRWRRYKEAEISFKKCMEMKEDGKRDRTLCYGLARVLSYLKKNDEAEMYFRLGMKEGRFYEVIHSSYARFLGRQRRYEESKKEYELCIKHKPNDAMLHYSLCGVLKQMKKMKGYEHHLNKALQLDPHLLQASREWTRYYRQPYAAANKQNRKEKEAVVVNRYVVEFDRFWFDCIGDGVDKRCKDRYYMEFKRCKMNDIRCIARNKKMESDLMNRIGVSQAHVVVMMDAIRLFRSKVNVFTEWMKTHKLGEAFGDIFEKNAIFTLESLSRLGYTKFEALAQQNRAKHINYERSIKRLWDTYMLTKHHMNNRYQKTNR